ncbi:MAG: FAD-dependent oxidoreductase [Aquificae bacterium]|nr:FAD-dependent oxidoreductase [Aquificota bacterium]
MAKIIIAGAGFAGHYAALILQDSLKKLDNNHQITVVSRVNKFTYIPSLVWVGVGDMEVKDVQFPLKPVYDRLDIDFVHGALTEVYPDDNQVKVELLEDTKADKKLSYDFLLIATGPYLNFEATPGLGVEKGFTASICSPPHAVDAYKRYISTLDRVLKGDKVKIVVGTGHGTATCQGAAFEYICNIHNDLVRKGIRDKVELLWLSNEPALGDFGIDGLEVKKGNDIFTSQMLVDALFDEYNINYEIRSHVHKIDEKKIYTENVEGEFKEINYDFAMLIPPFKAQPIKFVNKDGEDITEKVCNPAGFIKVDANYGKPYEELDGPDWPRYYQNPTYKNIFSAGIAFAPPGPLSKPSKSPNGTLISPAPPRTGYTAELSGKAAALNIVEMIKGNDPIHSASMAETPGLCVASLKKSIFTGEAVTIAIYPVARNYSKYPEFGRDLQMCAAEIGMAGAWFKFFLHYAFMYKLQAKPGWKFIP